MTNICIFWVYMGGLYPAYTQSRSFGKNIFVSVLNALTWPIGVGNYLASRFCSEYYKL